MRCIIRLLCCLSVAGFAQAKEAQAQALRLLSLDEAGRAVLSDGRRLPLAGIRLRVPPQDAPLDGWAGSPVRLRLAGETRYGEPFAYINREHDNALLQHHLVASQAALAYGPANQPEDAALLALPPAPLLDAGRAARALWDWAAIQGRISEVTLRRDDAYLNFGANWKTDFTIYIPKATRKQLSESELLALQGRDVIVRGFVHAYYGPRITLHYPAMMRVKEGKE